MDKIIEYKKLNAPMNTVTRNVMELTKETGNIYETAVIIARRADQISLDLKEELLEKLDAFAYYTDSPEKEIFENEEQIELSRQYERIPKSSLLALQEFMDERIEFGQKAEEAKEEGTPESETPEATS